MTGAPHALLKRAFCSSSRELPRWSDKGWRRRDGGHASRTATANASRSGSHACAWFALCGCVGSAVMISLKKKVPDYWDGLTTDKSYKKFIKVDFSKFCEEDDPEYSGDVSMAGMDDMGGMGGMGGMPGMGGMGGMGGMPGMGGMGGMDMSSLMSGMGGMGGMGDFDDDEEEGDADLGDLDGAEPPPPLEGDAPPPKAEEMEEVD